MTFMPGKILQTVQRPDTQKCLQKAIGSMQRLPYQPFHRKGSHIRKICTVISKMLLQIAKPFYKPILLIPPNRLSMINSGIRMLQPSGCKISCHHCKNQIKNTFPGKTYLLHPAPNHQKLFPAPVCTCCCRRQQNQMSSHKNLTENADRLGINSDRHDPGKLSTCQTIDNLLPACQQTNAF